MGRLSTQQIADRRLGIGSSDVATVLGLSPYQGNTPLALWLEKTGMAVEVERDEMALDLGHLLEPVLLGVFERQSGLTVLTHGDGVESVSHPDHPWRRANLDGRIKDKRAAVEVKVVGVGMMRDWDVNSDDGIPHYVRVQVAWQMHVADLDVVFVVALIGGTTFRVFEVARDLDIERQIVAVCSAFWHRVTTRAEPDVDGSAIARAWLNRLYPPREPEVVVTLDPEDDGDRGIIRLAHGRLVDAATERAAKSSKDLATNALIKAMGERECDVLYLPGEWRASYRTQGKKGRVFALRSLAPVGAVATGNADDGEVL